MWINKEYYRKPREGNGGVGEGFRINVEFEPGFRDVICLSKKGHWRPWKSGMVKREYEVGTEELSVSREL